MINSCERQRELVVGKTYVGKVGVDTGEVIRVEMDIQLSFGALVVHGSTIVGA